MTMDIRVLRYFLAVAREGTISGAAEALHMTQPPPVQAAQGAAEEELGKPLFLRGKRRITLTREGMLLRKRAEEIIGLVEKTKAEVTAGDESITGEITIGGGETDGHAPHRPGGAPGPGTPSGDPRPHAQWGRAMTWQSGWTGGSSTFGTLIEPVDVSRYDSRSGSTVLRRDHPLAQQAAIGSEDLAGLPLLASRQMVGENGLSGWLGYDYEKLNIVATGNLVNNLVLLVEEGVGCALTLDGVERFAGERLCFRPLAPRLESWMYLVWKKYQVFPPGSGGVPQPGPGQFGGIRGRGPGECCFKQSPGPLPGRQEKR